MTDARVADGAAGGAADAEEPADATTGVIDTAAGPVAVDGAAAETDGVTEAADERVAAAAAGNRPVWVTRGYEGEPTIVVLADPESLARDAATRIAVAVDHAIAENGEAHIALTGGSSAVALYHALGTPPWRDSIPWDRVRLWWGDERYVPLDHPESSANLAFSVLLRSDARSGQSGYGTAGVDVDAGSDPGVSVHVEDVHPIPVSEAIEHGWGPRWAAEAYAGEVRAAVPLDDDGTPIFDVVLLGLGADGHILSVFPDSPALRDDAPLAMAIPAPTHIRPHLQRVTLNPRIVPAARLVLVMIPGDAKAEILAEVLGGERDPYRWPGEAARCSNAVWLADRAAASRLPGAPPQVAAAG